MQARTGLCVGPTSLWTPLFSQRTYKCLPSYGQKMGRRLAASQGAQPQSKEEALRSMQSYRAGLSQALAKHEDQLKAQASPSEGDRVRASVTAQEGETDAPAGLRELTKDDFHSFLREAGGTLVVVDCYTDWCGPCKLILPQLVEMSKELQGRAYLAKFNCNKYNKELGISLGIKVAPTFLLYKGGEQVAMMTGAKVDGLRELIEQHI